MNPFSRYMAARDMCRVGKRMTERGFVAANDGNISLRLESTILITPTGVPKGAMSPSDLLLVDLEGRVISGRRKPTSEIKMHIAAYKKRSDIKAIIHAHPMYATAFAAARKGFDRITLPETIFTIGKISLSEYATPSTEEVPAAVEKSIEHSDAILLANHGALTVGNSLMDAYYKMETLEHFAGIVFHARMLGGETFLNESQVAELVRIRTQVFGKTGLKL